MNILAVILMFFGVLSISGHGLTQRYILRKDEDKGGEQILNAAEALFATFLVAIPFFILAYCVGVDWGTTAGGSSEKVFWIAVFGTTGFNILIQYAGAKAKENAEASLVTPVQAMTPGLLTASSIVVKEFPGIQGWSGVFLIMLGNYLHGLGEAAWRNWFSPFRLLKLPADFASLSEIQQYRALQKCRGLRWAYTSALAGTIGVLFDGILARNGDVALGYLVQAVVLALVFGVQSGSLRTGLGIRGFWDKARRRPRPVVLLGLFWVLHVLFVMTAFRLAPIAYIGSLKRLSILFTVFLSGLVLRERKATQRIWPAFVITAGAMLLGLDKTAGRVAIRAEQILAR